MDETAVRLLDVPPAMTAQEVAELIGIPLWQINAIERGQMLPESVRLTTSRARARAGDESLASALLDMWIERIPAVDEDYLASGQKGG